MVTMLQNWNVSADCNSNYQLLHTIFGSLQSAIILATDYCMCFISYQKTASKPMVNAFEFWLSNNLLFNNIEAQNFKKIKTYLATSLASKNWKYNNIWASCPTNDNFSLRFAIISVVFNYNCNMRRFHRCWKR